MIFKELKLKMNLLLSTIIHNPLALEKLYDIKTLISEMLQYKYLHQLLDEVGHMMHLIRKTYYIKMGKKNGNNQKVH